MNIKSGAAILISASIVVLGIIFTSAIGLWNTHSAKIPKKLSPEKITQQAAANSQAENTSEAGSEPLIYDPADIKGSHTFSDISELYNIPIQYLAEGFMVKESEADNFKCKDLEGLYPDEEYKVRPPSVRMFVSFYHGLDYSSPEEVYLPESAVKILKEKSKATPAQLEYLETHTIPMP